MAEIGAGSGGPEHGAHLDEERRPFLPILFGGLVLVAVLALVWGFAAALRPPAAAMSAAPVGKGAAVMLKGLHS
ncbi:MULTISPECIES: hypothetical protein [Acidiphilium]|uniref:Uncharacterized protein n=1 Tax=Acidiphilium rubrum TaxID=526 RepID=A0A8G2CN43_ACIRU|nr:MULTISPECIES: hypothetical protein [Acidiphilium]SIR36572.1 hypothetical protein SAMN05421828_12650 [Acidiphilium rubrum]